MTAPKCSVKSLLNAIAAALKLTYNQVEHYSFKFRYYSDVETF